MPSEVGEDSFDLFQEPEGFYEPEKQPTIASHQLLSGQELSVQLVGHNPLWVYLFLFKTKNSPSFLFAIVPVRVLLKLRCTDKKTPRFSMRQQPQTTFGHHLWNAGRTTSTYLEQHAADLVTGKTVLELGAGAGLPSLICSLSGASRVVVTDYPDTDLIDNLWHNINHCKLLPTPAQIVAEGYLWGAPIQSINKHLPGLEDSFDVLILADLLFNHSEHAKLVKTVQMTLKKAPGSKAYVFFTPYRPWLLEKDLAFFDLAREAGFVVEKTFEKVMDKVMFEEDPGDELLRRTVYGYELSWPL